MPWHRSRAARVARNVATIDKKGARTVGMTDKRRAAIGEATASCYALLFLRRFATGISEIGSRSERNAARRERNVGMSDKRRAVIGEATASCYALLFLRRFATGILEIGSRSERNAARRERNVGTIDARLAAISSRHGTHHVPTRMRRVGTSSVIRMCGLRFVRLFVRRFATKGLKGVRR